MYENILIILNLDMEFVASHWLGSDCCQTLSANSKVNSSIQDGHTPNQDPNLQTSKPSNLSLYHENATHVLRAGGE